MNEYTATNILRTAASIIDQRARERDLPAERSMPHTVRVFSTLTGIHLTEAQGCLFMVVLKLVRSTIGRTNPDDLIDAAAYMALTLEALTRLQENEEDEVDFDSILE